MSSLLKPMRRSTTRRMRVLGWLLGLRSAPAGAAEEWSIDVWQWTRAKYRLRALILLLINALLFAGLGCFALWLRTGRYFVGSLDEYWQAWWMAFDPTREHQLTLMDYLQYPIPVDQVPLMMVIMGLVMASLTAIPILVSMLYRFPYALIFTAIIAFVAMLPWLGLTVTLCCFLARWRALRFSFHYATALVALLPVIAYYALASQDASSEYVLTPAETFRLYVPWVLAVVAACVAMGVVLMIARLVNYRPGAIAPLLAVMFATPVALFEAKVGRDELHYRLLESDFGPASKTHFVENVDASAALRRLIERRKVELDEAGLPVEAAAEQVTLQWELRLLSEAFAAQKQEALVACDAFYKSYPDSRYIPNVLYLKGRTLDIRLDREAARRQMVLRYYQEFPNQASRPVWAEIYERFSASPLWKLAGLRLAMLSAQSGQVDEAIGILDKVVAETEKPRNESPAKAAEGWSALFAKRSASGSLGVDESSVLLEARMFRDLLTHNRDPEQKDAALLRLLSLDPRHAMYRSNLEQLRADVPTRYPMTRLTDNVDVLIAASEPSRSRRIERLKVCVESLLKMPQSDALPQARYELGLVYQEDNRPDEARAMFDEVVRLHPESPWAREASSKLAGMGMAGRAQE